MAQNKKEQQNKKEPQNKKEVQNQKSSQAPQGRKKFKMDLHTRNSLKGLVFVSPFILGVLMFFIYPIFFSIRLSVSTDIKVVGMHMSGFTFKEYVEAFVVDKEFLPLFGQTIKDTLINFPLTVVLSLTTITDAVQMVLGVLVTVLWGCGVQILLFLSGLQSISPSLYEAAKIDGATEWELFWKVTIPMISPMMLLNLVYTLVNSFVNGSNELLTYINTKGLQDYMFGAALGWIYFSVIGLLVAIVFGVMQKHIHTSEIEEVKKRERKHRVFTIEKAPKRTFE